jgi:hypothetical protein
VDVDTHVTDVVRLVELPTGHWPMFSVPAELADTLAGLA